jgi:hypothetical protein
MNAPRNALAGLPIDLVVNEPWDLTAADGSVRFQATVAKALTYGEGADEERLLVELIDPVNWHGRTFRFFVARHRHGHGLVDDVSRGRAVECSLIAVPDDQANSADPFDTSQWRGGLSARATIEPKP